jgi:hypothetical protein
MDDFVENLVQGGGWCNTVRACVYRKKTRRGSSNYMEKQLAFTGILSNKPEENPGLALTLKYFKIPLYLSHLTLDALLTWGLQIFSTGTE